jgi:hypothetical protein
VQQVGKDLQTFAAHLFEATREPRITHAFTVRSGLITAPADGAEY